MIYKCIHVNEYSWLTLGEIYDIDSSHFFHSSITIDTVAKKSLPWRSYNAARKIGLYSLTGFEEAYNEEWIREFEAL